jgi:DNA polymerase-1
MATLKPVLVGVIKGKEYYLAPPDKNHLEPYLVWRVPDIREGIRARPGWKILGADYSQIEVRIMAMMSGDEWLIEALNSGKDIHCYMAADVNGIDYDDFYKAYKDPTHPLYNLYYGMRSEIKTTTFGVPYGAGPEQVARQINATRKDKSTHIDGDYAREKIIDPYFAKAKGLKKWLENQGKNATKHFGPYNNNYIREAIDYSVSLGSHYRFYQLPYEGADDADERLSQIRRWSGNHPIQAGCADMLKMAVGKISCDLHRERCLELPLSFEAHFLLFVHDEIVMTAREDHTEAVKGIMLDDMQWAYNKMIGLKNIIHETDVTIADFWKKG